MAGEIYATWPESATLYAVIRRLSDGAVYDATNAAFVTWDDADLSDYAISLTDYDGNHYAVDFPLGIPAGQYKIDIFIQSGGSPADGDWTPTYGYMNWGGQAEVSTASLEDAIEDLEDAIGNLQQSQNRVKTVIPVKTKKETKTRIYL